MDAETAVRAREMLLVHMEEGRPRVHTIASGIFSVIGCDWDLEDVEDFIDAADAVDLVDSGTLADSLGHRLWIRSGGKEICFETKRGVVCEPE